MSKWIDDQIVIDFPVPSSIRQIISELEKYDKEEDVYFYHCPKLNECKRCSDYENRPQICRDFPDNPLSILPESCGFYKWRQEVEPVVLMLHSMMEIIDYYRQKIPYKKELP